jgi:tetratricopeptide (TPR) repeat protein
MLVASKLAFNYIYNEYMISQYDKGNYDVSVQPIFSCNWVQPYVPHYNAGNMYYDKGEYELAIKEYKQALKREPKNHLCDIRVNMALSMIGTLPEEYSSEENIEKTINVLTEARNILIQDGCAEEKGDGHDEEATKLKKEIDSILESMKNGQGSEPGGDPTEPVEPAEPSTENGHGVDEDDIKNKLQQQQKNGFKEREENEQYYKEDEWGEYMDKPVW